MAVKYATLGAAVRDIPRAQRVMGRHSLYRIKNAKDGKPGFYIACYSHPVQMPAAVIASGLPVHMVDGQYRAFLGYY